MLFQIKSIMIISKSFEIAELTQIVNGSKKIETEARKWFIEK
jgi:hypothetical protein